MLFPTDDQFDSVLARLPTSPQVLFEIIGLCNEAETVTADILPIVRKDAALTARLIELTGNFGGFFSAPANTPDAMPLPDMIPAIRAIASTSAIQQFFAPLDNTSAELWARLWLSSLTCAYLCQNLAKLSGNDPEEAFMAGLLHQIGRLACLISDAQAYAPMLAEASDSTSLLMRESSHFGCHSGEIGSQLLRRWPHADLMADAVLHQNAPVELLHDATDLVRLLNLGTRLCEHLTLDIENLKDCTDPFFGLSTSVLNKQFDEALQSAAAAARDIGIDVEDSHFGVHVKLEDESIRRSLGNLVREAALQESLEQPLRSAGDFAGLRRGLGDNLRVLLDLGKHILWLPDFDSNQLKASPDDSDRVPALGHMAITLQAERSLLSEAALKKRVVISNHQDRFTTLPIIDQQILRQLNAPVMLCLPLVHQRRLYGVLAIGCSLKQAESLHHDEDLLDLFMRVGARSLAHLTLTANTQRAQIEQLQQESQLRVRKLVHEVNNPLTAINNYLEVLRKTLDESDKVNESMSTMQSEIMRISEILQRFKSQSTENLSDHSQIDINALIHKTIEFFEPTFYKQARIQSVTQLDPSNPSVQTDSIKLKQILTNLLKNAAEALTEGGQITIKTRGSVFVNSKLYTEIAISDNGSGLPPAVLQNLYHPVETSKGGDHSGLGLAIVYKLVSELRGIIHYTTSDTGGAQFSVLLPKS